MIHIRPAALPPPHRPNCQHRQISATNTIYLPHTQCIESMAFVQTQTAAVPLSSPARAGDHRQAGFLKAVEDSPARSVDRGRILEGRLGLGK